MQQRGFSLIELSIVLVILGLIVGGIVGGRALVHQAELQKLIKDIYSYETAFNTYISQHDALPGDHAIATQYWPGQTQDGNGDGMLWSSGAANGQARYESQKVFDHLFLAELIPFKPQGYADAGDWVVGVNVPEGPISGQGYQVESAPWNGTQNGNTYGRRGTRLIAAMPNEWDLYTAIIKPADAKNIDTKIDDGRPTLGRIVADDYPNYGTCVQGKTVGAEAMSAGNYPYNVANTDISCTILYWLK